MNVFGTYSLYYDILYRDKDFDGEVHFVSEPPMQIICWNSDAELVFTLRNWPQKVIECEVWILALRC